MDERDGVTEVGTGQLCGEKSEQESRQCVVEKELQEIYRNHGYFSQRVFVMAVSPVIVLT